MAINDKNRQNALERHQISSGTPGCADRRIGILHLWLGYARILRQMRFTVSVGQEYRRDNLLLHLVELQYKRNDFDFFRGTFRVRGDVLDIFPSYEDDLAIRIEFFGDEVERLSEIDPLTGKIIKTY